MSRFFIEDSPEGQHITLTGTEAHHVLHVKRAKSGDELIVFDKNGVEYQTKVIHCGRKDVQLEILSQNKKLQERNVNLCLGQSLIKRKSWDVILQKSMELGLTNLVPLISQHTCEKKIAGSEERWQKIVVAAAKQCHRNDFVEISATQSFREFVQQPPSSQELRLIAHNSPHSRPLKAVLDSINPSPKKVTVMVGPEGGFHEKEVVLAEENQFIPISLGRNILRAETAAMAVMANIYFYYETD